MNLTPLIQPRSIAVLGASQRSALGLWIIQSLDVLGFDGDIWPVNPKYDTVAGRTCYPSLIDLPAAPDVTAFCIGRAGVGENLKLLAQAGGRAAVIHDSGFAERDEDGARLQRDMVDLCREADIALCGPNCMGVLTPSAKSSTFKQMIRRADGLAGDVGLISQSGSICGSLLADLRRFGFSAVISSGNEAVATSADYLHFLVDDPATKIIALFTESVRDPERFVDGLDRAARAGKPVVVLKVGRSERTRHAITSHTGGLAGESRVFSEVLRAHRAIEVADLDEMTEVIACCQSPRLPKGGNINILTTSGGQAELILDVATECGIDLKPLPRESRARVEAEVGAITGDGNPLDAWGNGDVKKNMPAALRVLQENEGTDIVVFCSSDSTDDQMLGREGRELDYANLLADVAHSSPLPHVMLTMRPGVMHTGQVKILARAGVPVVCGTRQGLTAMKKLAQWSTSKEPSDKAAINLPPLPPGRRVINEYDAKRLLADAGLPVAREELCADLAEARAAARRIGFPVVVKAVSDDIPHKSEHGLVAVGVKGEDELAAILTRMTGVVEALGAKLDGWLVQELIEDGVEVFAGVSRDPDFGLSISFGMGGVGIEVLRDFALRMLPLRQGDAAAMIADVRGAALLGAFRGRPAADIDALTKTIEALGDFAMAHEQQVAEIDLNPIKVRAGQGGCVVVDALIVQRQTGSKSTNSKSD